MTTWTDVWPELIKEGKDLNAEMREALGPLLKFPEVEELMETHEETCGGLTMLAFQRNTLLDLIKDATDLATLQAQTQALIEEWSQQVDELFPEEDD